MDGEFLWEEKYVLFVVGEGGTGGVRGGWDVYFYTYKMYDSGSNNEDILLKLEN